MCVWGGVGVNGYVGVGVWVLESQAAVDLPCGM